MFIVHIKYFLKCEFYSMSKFNNQRALTSVIFNECRLWLSQVVHFLSVSQLMVITVAK